MKCFVIMPFGNSRVAPEEARHLTHLYEGEIKPTVEGPHIIGHASYTIECARADEDTRSGYVITHIIERLFEADIVIADLSGRNANVFYELGVRHSIGKPTILIADNLETIPFDLRGMRTVPYEYTLEGLASFRRQLKEALQTVIASPESSDNPVSRFLLNREIERIRAQNAPPQFDAVKQLLVEMQSLKAIVKTQGDEMKILAGGLTAQPKKDSGGHLSPDDILAALQGVWYALPSNSLVCIRMVNGQLHAPYCFGGDSHLTAHYFNFRRVGQMIFARYEWFKSPIAGYGMYRLITPDKLEGGWWFDEAVPEAVRCGTAVPTDSLLDMSPTTLTRIGEHKEFPPWAEEYFARLDYYMSLREKESTQH